MSCQLRDLLSMILSGDRIASKTVNNDQLIIIQPYPLPDPVPYIDCRLSDAYSSENYTIIGNIFLSSCCLLWINVKSFRRKRPTSWLGISKHDDKVQFIAIMIEA